MDTLSKIAEHHITDKGLIHHGYTPIYNKYFEHLRKQDLLLLEVGVGGYEFNDRGGGSLNMWAEYFPNGRIIGVDLYDKSRVKKFSNVEIHQCDQTDGHKFAQILNGSNPDIIIDDGSHINALTIQTFRILFPYLKKGGIYVIEDANTSYWKEYYSGTKDLKSSENTIGFARDLVHSIYPESEQPNEYGITSIHFYHKLIFIFK